MRFRRLIFWLFIVAILGYMARNFLMGTLTILNDPAVDTALKGVVQ